MGDKTLKDGLRKLFVDYQIVQVETMLSIGIIGSLFAPDVTIKFYYFFLPPILGLICMVPCVIDYFLPTVTVNQMRGIRALELILLEVVVYAIIYLIFGDSVGKVVYLACVVSTLVLDVATYVISDLLEKKEVEELNTILGRLRENLDEDDDEDVDENDV